MIVRLRGHKQRKLRALSIRPKIPEIPGLGANGTDIFPEFHSEILGVPREVGLKFRKIGITENSVPFDHSCSGLVSPRLEIEFNMSDPQASKHKLNISALTNN